MMINSKNIVDYINFLYQRKHGEDAPRDVLDSWSGLNDEEALKNLIDLYHYWSLNDADAGAFESEFLNRGKFKPVMPPPQPKSGIPDNVPPSNFPPYTMPGIPNSGSPVSTRPKRRSGTWILIVLLLILCGGGGYYIWQLKNQPDSVPQEVVDTNNANQPADSDQHPAREVQPEALPVTESDKLNARVIMDLQEAESEQNFDKIYSYFDPNMERYWNINYPTYDELLQAYQKSWDVASNIQHADVKINKVADNTYNVTETYSYFYSKTNAIRTLHPTTRFVFNDDHKIIKTYGL